MPRNDACKLLILGDTEVSLPAQFTYGGQTYVNKIDFKIKLATEVFVEWTRTVPESVHSMAVSVGLKQF